MLIGIIVACEVGFWVAVLAGLSARYLVRAPRVGVALLALAPLIDLVLLVATAVHLRSGADATAAHGLAAAYIGFSVAYGHRMIVWADRRFAHRFADGPAPVRLDGWPYARACWADVARTLLAAGIAAAILWTLVWWVDEPARTAALDQWFAILGIVVAIDLLWAVSYTIWPRAAKASSSAVARR
ncbi:hypothetical protein [Sanguibacter sp. 25GB23B1]|uniref:hypothetical protein n=1 Tax=unclassified Sanguibacter TaxID=2645534 RepID=UPI0032B015F6